MAALPILAQGQMYHDHMDGGWGWGMAAFMVLAVVVIAGLVVWIVRSAGAHQPHAGHHPADAPTETPMQTLDRRLAQGDITPDDYQERAAILSRR